MQNSTHNFLKMLKKKRKDQYSSLSITKGNFYFSHFTINIRNVKDFFKSYSSKSRLLKNLPGNSNMNKLKYRKTWCINLILMFNNKI